MKKFSLTQGGILIAVVGSILTSMGFSEVCTGEIITQIPLFVGGALAWIGRWRQGDVTIFGFKK